MKKKGTIYCITCTEEYRKDQIKRKQTTEEVGKAHEKAKSKDADHKTDDKGWKVDLKKKYEAAEDSQWDHRGAWNGDHKTDDKRWKVEFKKKYEGAEDSQWDHRGAWKGDRKTDDKGWKVDFKKKYEGAEDSKWDHRGAWEGDHKTDDKGWKADVKNKSEDADDSCGKDKDNQWGHWGKRRRANALSVSGWYVRLFA